MVAFSKSLPFKIGGILMVLMIGTSDGQENLDTIVNESTIEGTYDY